MLHGAKGMIAMKDDFETQLRLIREAEADIGFERDEPAKEGPIATLMKTAAEPGIALMRTLWMPNWRK